MSACFPIERLFSNYSDITNRLLLANIPHEASGTKNWELECEKTLVFKDRRQTDRWKRVKILLMSKEEENRGISAAIDFA